MKNFKSIQYAAQTGPYKVFVKDKGLWQGHDTARLQISVGNPKHDGDKFFALAEWAAARFEKVILIVSDTLQRHNLSFYRGMSESSAYQASLDMGNYWLHKNQKAIDILPNKIITRWNDWINDTAYADARHVIQKQFDANEYFRATVEAKALEFSVRQFGLSNPDAVKVSVKYILEELAAFALMFSRERAIDVYPGSWFMEIFEVLATLNISLAEEFRSAECLRVDFVKNKSYANNNTPDTFISVSQAV